MNTLQKNLALRGVHPGESAWFYAGQAERTQYTNIAVSPNGTLRPWRTGKTYYYPPVLRTDGQITWLPDYSPRTQKVGRQ